MSSTEDDQYKDFFFLQERLLDHTPPSDICSVIKKHVLQEEDLKNHPGVKTILNSIQIFDSAVDLSGGNADDKIEVTVLELGNHTKIRIEYFYMFNWSYGEAHLILNSYQSGEKTNLLTFTDEDSGEITLNTLKPLCELATILEMKDLSIQSFSKFIIQLLSRMVQKEFLLWQEHGINIRLDPIENYDLDEQLATLVSETPINDLNFD